MATNLNAQISCVEVRQLLDNSTDMLLLDCREPDEFETACIAGAELWPMSELADRVEELAPHKGRRIVVYCHHGMRSLRVSSWLRQQGFDQSQSMAGGIDAWSQEIDPSVRRY
ncbi:MAG: rhodanese-like domain-containing protein [Planctomycetaceae bacterium]